MPRAAKTIAVGPAEERGIRVLVLLLPRVHLLDLGGPIQALSEANGFGAHYEMVFCAAGNRVQSAQGLALGELVPPPEPCTDDLVIVPGVEAATLGAIPPRSASWLREAHARGARVASVCSGAFALGAAGLLSGRACTTHWRLTERLQRLYPTARVLGNRLYVCDGRVVTSAGIASGVDMALSLIEEDYGEVMVANVAREMVVYLRRSGQEEQASIYLSHRSHIHPSVHRIQDWLIAHPDRRPSLEALARVACMSARNLNRAFRKATGITPKVFANKVKLQVARDLFTDPSQTVATVAASCGFDDPRQLRRLWRRSFGVSISEWRRVSRNEAACSLGGEKPSRKAAALVGG
jgi:transcriptional regulator GlxA family with amidase domain